MRASQLLKQADGVSAFACEISHGGKRLAHAEIKAYQPDDIEPYLNDLAKELRAVPIGLADDRVIVAVVDPSPEHVAEVAAALGRSVTPAVTTHRAMERTLATEYKATREVGSHVQEFEARDSLRREADKLETATVNEDAPVVQVVQTYE